MSSSGDVTDKPYKLFCMYKSPGPAYKLKSMFGQDICLTKQRSPAYSFGGPYKWKPNDSPGPCYGYNSNLTSTGTQYTKTAYISSRPMKKEPQITPGPGEYQPALTIMGKSSRTKGPSLGQRSKTFPNLNPPPNAYKNDTGIGTYNRSNSFARKPPFALLRSRTELGGIYYPSFKAANPGPAAYDRIHSYNSASMQGGAIITACTIKSRVQVKDFNTVKDNPGPGSYNMRSDFDPNSSVNRRKNAYMGIKHSPYLMPLF